MSNIIAAAYEAWDEEIRKNNLTTKNNDRQNARKRHCKNNNLEKEIHSQAMKLHTAPTYEELRKFALHFVEWKKEQMIAKAVDGEVGYWNIRGLSINMELPSKLEEGDKVKLIVIKED